MKTILWLIVVAALLISCKENNITSSDEFRDHASYKFTITGSEGGPHHLVGEDLYGSNWDIETGLIYLNTDRSNEPLGTLKITIGNIEELFNASRINIYSRLVSKTDKKSGTADVLNARNFTLADLGESAAGYLDSIKVGSNFFSARFQMTMERVLYWPEDNPETVAVTGWFVAVD